jgi:hypothetical protein
MSISGTFALFREKALQQLVGLTAGELIIVLKEKNKRIEILSQFFQFNLLFGRTQTEPAFRFLCVSLSNCFGDP